ncbi:MAG: 16S rRNA (guanine(966)-N(2))-methyltransferase RsmD [Pseudomonadales bacterium]|nr:16S rRNA (guanine(966)-N(2))-methyltransferase RsmD [Gammaproteobacteria bacterium]NNL56364.1 16S rRNA (guanine(966)-N(2))-methyltransferase RsmD [Pseudomonadales bacterium]
MPGKASRAGPQSPRQLRIIAGTWRGSKLSFVDAGGLRPTGDRIRETLFNWLQGRIDGAHCLDLFAGSGVLAFEALSRGAASAVAIDNNRAAIKQMQAAARRLGANTLELYCSDALAWLQREAVVKPASTFDIAFIDPPFGAKLVPASIAALEQSDLLAGDALVYVEQESGAALPQPPAHWQLVKNRLAGQVNYLLYSRHLPLPV